MDTNSALTSATIGAAVAAVTVLALHKIQSVRSSLAVQAQLAHAEKDGYTRGWWEGRESVLQDLAAEGNVRAEEHANQSR